MIKIRYLAAIGIFCAAVAGLVSLATGGDGWTAALVVLCVALGLGVGLFGISRFGDGR